MPSPNYNDHKRKRSPFSIFPTSKDVHRSRGSLRDYKVDNETRGVRVYTHTHTHTRNLLTALTVLSMKYIFKKKDIYSFRLSSEVVKQLVVLHGRRLSFGLDHFLQGLGDLLPAFACGGTHTWSHKCIQSSTTKRFVGLQRTIVFVLCSLFWLYAAAL